MLNTIYLLYNILTAAIVTAVCIYAFVRGKKNGLKELSEHTAAQVSAIDGGGDKTDKKSGLCTLVTLGDLIRNHPLIPLLAIFAIFLFSRLFRLSINPAGIHLDEIGISYDAYSLLHFGTDRFGRSYPVYPTNYGDGCSAMYTYLEMLILRFLPFSAFSMRLPAVI
ncbi:MAG: hypothetical protein K6G22_07020, partial [Lachnospiraceae bacterium]|nr:hypothetical protein [Lachnospiraceae bacterium]